MIKRLMVLMVAATVASTTLDAQGRVPRANRRDGFWLGFGLGGGSTGVDCFHCSDNRSDGVSGYFRAGGTINRNWLLGGEANGWSHTHNSVDESLSFVTFIASWYPSARDGFFLKAGIGAMKYRADDRDEELRATAPAGSIGMGYDFPVAATLSLTPFVNVLGTSAVRFRVNGVSAPSGREITLNLVQAGLGLHWQ